MLSSSSRRRTKRLKTIAIAAGSGVLVLGLGLGLAATLDNAEPAPVSRQVADYYAQNATAKPITKDEPTAEPTAPLSTFTVEDVKAQLGKGGKTTVSVMGDSTGNSGGEWVDLWARHLGGTASVQMHMWDETIEDWKPQPVFYGSGPKQIEIWNGSHPGASIEYGLDGLDKLQPARPDFAIFNYGHNQALTKIDEGLGGLSQKIDAKWGVKVPAVVTVQNPSQGDREVTSAAAAARVSEWGPRQGFPVIDVVAAFAEAGPLPALLRDNVHPNDAGSRIWADKVIATIG